MRKEMFNHEITILRDTYRRLLRRNAKINLINLNPHKKIPYKPVSIAKIHAIQSVIKKQKCAVTIRYKKGQDITAACGQLGESYLN